jgi:hypothetical protein
MRSLIRDNRDLRVDFFRGYALFCIFVGHIPDHQLWVFTIQVLGPSDATEAFVFLAGFSAAFAYGRAWERSGWAYAAFAVLQRVWTLYLVHIFMFLAFIAQVSWSTTRFANPAYLDEVNIGGFLQEMHVAVLDALSLRLQPAFMDILPLYIVVLAIFAAQLPLLRRPWLLLAVSGAGWLLVRVTRFNLATVHGDWFFNPLAWQFLFVIGVAMARLGPEARAWFTRWRQPLLAGAIVVAVAGLLVSAVWRLDPIYDLLPDTLAQPIYTRIDKAGLHPVRLLHFLALAYLASRLVPPGAAWLLSPLAQPFTLCGQHGLVVFALGVFLSFVGRLVMQEIDTTLPTQVGIALGGWAICCGIAALQAWHDNQAGKTGGGSKPGPRTALATIARADSKAA